MSVLVLVLVIVICTTRRWSLAYTRGKHKMEMKKIFYTIRSRCIGPVSEATKSRVRILNALSGLSNFNAAGLTLAAIDDIV